MKHQNIASTLGWSEVPETTEGLFLQPTEAATIDTALGANADNVAQIATLTEQITALTNRATTAESALATANATIQTQATEIATLKEGDAGAFAGAATKDADAFAASGVDANQMDFQKELLSKVD